MKNLKLGTKIALGFGIILIIAVAVGTMAVWKMRGVTGETTILAQEYVPEVDVIFRLEKLVSENLFQVRGYNFTERPQYLEDARKSDDLENKLRVMDLNELVVRALGLGGKQSA